MEDELDTEMTDAPAVVSGGLSTAAALQSYRAQQALVEKQIRSNMDRIMEARDNLRAQRVGPSAAERLFAISAALGKPTNTGRFSESMANLGETLGAQERAKREAARENEALAEKYGMQIGNEQLRLLMQGQTGAGQVLRAAQAAAKAPALGETERMIKRALALPEGNPERNMLLAAIRGTPENIAAAVTKAAGIQDTKPPPSSKAGKPKYKRGPDGKIYKWSPE